MAVEEDHKYEVWYSHPNGDRRHLKRNSKKEAEAEVDALAEDVDAEGNPRFSAVEIIAV